jgi:cephalosporin hydroxylase
MADYPVDYRDFLLPGTIQENWQMTNADKIGLAGVLARIRPRLALEIGVYYGGSTSLIAQYAQELICIDIDPEVVNRFDVPSNAKISIGNSADLITSILANITENRRPLEFILLDADHSAEGVQRDLEQLLRFWPTTPMVLMMHDTANRECRKGILSVDWNANPVSRR